MDRQSVITSEWPPGQIRDNSPGISGCLVAKESDILPVGEGHSVNSMPWGNTGDCHGSWKWASTKNPQMGYNTLDLGIVVAVNAVWRCSTGFPSNLSPIP